MINKKRLVLCSFMVSALCFNPGALSQELDLTETDSVLVINGDANSGLSTPLAFEEKTLTGSYGSVKIFQNGTYDYVSNAAHDVLVEGAKYSEVFAFTALDSTAWSLTVNITGANDIPAISKLHYVLDATQNSNLDRASGMLRIADRDTGQSYFVEQVETDNTYGLFSLTSNGVWNYTTKASHESLLVGKSVSDSFTITAADGSQASVSFTIRGSKNIDATVVAGISHYAIPETGSLTLRREVLKNGPNFTESDGWNNHRATVETLFKLESGKRYSFKAQGISMGDPIIELAGPIAENTTYSVASQPEYGTVTVDQYTGSWLYAVNEGVTASRDWDGFELALTTDQVVTVPASSTLTSKERTKVGTVNSPSEYKIELVGKTITFKGSRDGTLTGDGYSNDSTFEPDMSFQVVSDLSPGSDPSAIYDASYPRLYIHVETDGSSTINQILLAINELDFFFDVKATTLLESGVVGLKDKAIAGGNVNRWIAHNDSGDYMGKDAEIIITAKATGYYLLRCFGGGSSGNFDVGDLDLIVKKIAADDFGGDRSLLLDVESGGDLVQPVSIREEWEDKTVAAGEIDGSAPAALDVNTHFKGTLTNGDVDYVKVNLEIERWYTFEVGGDLSDPKIDLVNADGGWVVNGGEDGGVGLNGKVGFALSPGGSNAAGVYYVVIQSGSPSYWPHSGARAPGDDSGEYVVKFLGGVRGQSGHWLENKDSNVLTGTVPENDVPVGVATTATPSIGSAFSGAIDLDSDRDWYKYSLVKDKIYRWNLQSISLVNGSVVLRDSTGETIIVYDKLGVGGDGVVETEGSIVHRAEYTGDYFVEVYSDADIDPENANAAIGSFNLSSTELSDDFGGYIISDGDPSFTPISYNLNDAGYLQAGSRVYSDFYSGIELWPNDIKGEQIDLSGNPRGDLDFFGVDLFSSNTYSFATYETEAGESLGDNSGNYSAITLYDNAGNKVEGGIWKDGFSYTPEADGYYYLRATSYNGPGGYMITSSFYGDDYSSNDKTRGRVFLGESVTGELETEDDDDWIRADLTAGQRYKFEPDQSIGNRQFELYGPGEVYNVDVQRALDWGGTLEDGYSKLDAGQDAATARAIPNAYGDVNGGFKAQIPPGDKDWYAVMFEEGGVYQVNLVGMPVYKKPALPDPMLTLFGPDGQFIKLGNNNAGVNSAHSGVPGKDSELVYTATETGTFYVEVKAETNRPIGDFTANGPAVSGATTIDLNKIGTVLSPGDVLVFSSDAIFTIGVEATVNSTALTGQLVGGVADGETAYLCDLVIGENASNGAASISIVNPTKSKFGIGDVLEFTNNASFTVGAVTDKGVTTLTGVLSGNVGAGDTGYSVGVGGYGIISTKLPVDKIATQYVDIIDWTPQYSAPYYLNFASWHGDTGEYQISMGSLPDASGADVVGSSRDSAVAFVLGETVTTKIDYGGDLDWFQFEMLAGESYAIEMQGAGAGTFANINVRDRFGKDVGGWDYGTYWGSNEELGIASENSKIFYYSTPLYHLEPETVPLTYYLQIGANIAGDVTFKVTHLFDDQKESPLTTGVLNVGDTASGTWENGVENGANIELIHGTGGGDGDWFKMKLIAGNTYKIDLFTDPLNRPSMYMFAEDGTYLHPGDREKCWYCEPIELETIKDGHAQLTYTANRTGVFFVDPINTKSWGGNNIYDLSLVHIPDDVASSIATSATLEVGGQANGNLERVNDRDWFKVILKRGHVYRFDLIGVSLKDPTLRIRDSHGNQLLYNDQINGWWNPSITYTATEDGIYYVDTAGIDSGQFTMKCTNTYSPPSGGDFFIGKDLELKNDDQSDSVDSAVSHTIGNVVQGEITLPNDRKWYKINLSKARAYEFHLFGDSMQSPSLYLRDNKGSPIFPCPELDKLRSTGEKLVLQYTAPKDGEYILDAGGFWSHASGVSTSGVATGTFSLQTFDLGLNSYRAVKWDTGFADAIADEALSVLGVGNSVSGSIEHAANRDLYKVSLIEGASYTFRIDGQLVNAEIDLGVQSRLFLHSSEGGLLVTETNDSLGYKATQTGVCYLAVGATTGQPSGVNFRENSVVPYAYDLKVIQSRAPKTEPSVNWIATLNDSGITTLVANGISDNSLSRAEVIAILESVKDGSLVDEGELNDLRILVANHKEAGLSNYIATILDNIANGDPANQFYTGRDQNNNGRTSRVEIGNLYPDSSTDRLDKLISKWFLGSDSPADSSLYIRLDLPLYFNGAGTDDVNQGNVGDCYFISAISAIADTVVGSIDGTVASVNTGDMVVDNNDGTYGVRFYDNSGAERWVTVDKFVPGYREDKLKFGDTDSGESWAMLVEKAYVQLNESDNIGQDGTNRYGIGNNFGIAGGDPGQALSHITGQKASYGFIAEDSTDWTADKLRALIEADLPMVFSTGAPCGLASSYGVKRRHAYTYESYDPVTQKFYLRNAWGVAHANVTFEGLQIMGSNVAYLDGTRTKMQRIDASSTFSAAYGSFGDDEGGDTGLTEVESLGAVKLYKDDQDRLYAGSTPQGSKPVKINGKLITVSLHGRTAISAETVSGANQILWRNNVSGALMAINFDSSWQFLPTNNDPMNVGSAGFYAAEAAFGVDSDGDSYIGQQGAASDTTAPVITLNGAQSVTHEGGLDYTDLGATANDDINGQVNVSSSGTVDTSSVGSYTITFSAADAVGNIATKNRTITVVDTTAPAITLTGGSAVSIQKGSVYSDAGAAAADTIDGNLSTTTSGVVDESTPGGYTLIYSVTDTAGNIATENRIVTVLEGETFGDAVVYSNNSATLIASVSINGEVSGDGDVLATYVGDELRQKTSVNVNGGKAWVLSLVNAKGGNEAISFKVFDASTGVTFERSKFSSELTASLIMSPGSSLGTYASPVEIKMDSVAPVLTLLGQSEVRIDQGLTYTDDGASAVDNVDGDITSKIVKTGTVDTLTAGTYTLNYNVSDAAENAAATVSRTVIVKNVTETQTLSLKAGWNLVSFYVEPTDMSAATVLASISSSLLQIKDLTRSYDPNIPAFLNTLDNLSVKDGYWVKMSEDVSFDVEGTVPSGASISVKSGWNLVGYPRLTGEATGDELTSLGSTVVQIKNLTKSFDPSLPSFLNTLSTMVPGSGYWLKVSADGTWTVGTVSESGAGRGLGKMGPGDVDPDWGRVVVYPHVSATVLSEVSVGGKPVSGGSVVGAFVGEELRAEQKVVLANGRSYATLNVNLTGKERVTFRIREAASGKEYRVARVMELGLGERLGRAEELVKLNAVMTGSGVSLLSYTHSPFGFSFDTGKDKSYTVEATGDLLKWNRVETFQGTGSAVQFTDTRKALFEKQYYRVKTQQ